MQLKGLGQVQGGVVERQTMDGCPEIQHVPLDPAIGVEALKGGTEQEISASFDRFESATKHVSISCLDPPD